MLKKACMLAACLDTAWSCSTVPKPVPRCALDQEGQPYKLLCVFVAAEWDEFKTLDFKKIYSTMTKPAFIFDGMPLFCNMAGPTLQRR